MEGIRIEDLERKLDELERGKIVVVSEVQHIKRLIERKRNKKNG